MKGGEGLGFLDLFKLHSKKGMKLSSKDWVLVEQLTAEVAYKKMAIDACVDLIANSILKTEFETYKKGQKERKALYYMLNVKPNKNMNQKNFLKKVVYKLLYENECLIVQTSPEELFIADDFIREEKGIGENVYSFITINNVQLNRTFSESEVMYLTYYEDNIMKCINSLYSSYGKLLTAAMNIYKRTNAKRYVMKGNFIRPQNDEMQEAVDEMINEQMRPWMEADNAGAIFQLQENYTLENVDSTGKTAATTSKDVRDVINQFYDLVSTSFHIPRGLFKGETVELSGQVDAMLNFISIPIVELLVSEINGKMYSKKEYLERTYLRADTSRLNVVSLGDMATALDKLFQIGGLCVDDVIEMLGGEPFNEEWSQRRFITKNYGDARSLNLEEGGEENESGNQSANETTTAVNRK